MTQQPLIYVDFQNADALGRLRLNAVGTIDDLARQQVKLENGLTVGLYSEDGDDQERPQRLFTTGKVEFSSEEQCWVAIIDWDRIRADPLPASPSVTLISEFGSHNVTPETRSTT